MRDAPLVRVTGEDLGVTEDLLGVSPETRFARVYPLVRAKVAALGPAERERFWALADTQTGSTVVREYLERLHGTGELSLPPDQVPRG